MTKPSGATASEKPKRGSVSSPKREIIGVRVGESPEGNFLLFHVLELGEKPHNVIGGQINMEASDPDSDKCPKCQERLDVKQTHHNSEGDITHWDVECPNCGLTGQVWND